MGAKPKGIISKGRVTNLAVNELDELRTLNLGWFAYSQARLTRNHADAVQHLTRFAHRQLLMSQSSNEYKGFPVSAEGPYQESQKFPDGHWYGTMGGRIVTAPASTREAAIQDAQVAVDQVVGGYLQAHGEKGQELLDLTESLLKRR